MSGEFREAEIQKLVAAARQAVQILDTLIAAKAFECVDTEGTCKATAATLLKGSIEELRQAAERFQ
jgi:hypothetical protein